MNKTLGNALVFFFNQVVFPFLGFFKLFLLVRKGNAIGDQVCMTAMPRQIFVKHELKTIVFTNFPELFQNNPYIIKIIDNNKTNKFLLRLILFFAKNSKSPFVEEFNFTHPYLNLEEFMRAEGRHLKDHLIELHSSHFKLPLDLGQPAGDLHFSSLEETLLKNRYPWAEKKFIIFHSKTKESYTPIKSWDLDKIQQLVNDLTCSYQVIQLGLKDDPPLSNVINLCGKTTIRETALLIKNSSFVVSTEGLLNHLAGCFGTRSFVIFSGFHHHEISGYKNTIPVKSKKEIDCSPCWLLEPCDKGTPPPCTESITSQDVLATINRTKSEV